MAGWRAAREVRGSSHLPSRVTGGSVVVARART